MCAAEEQRAAPGFRGGRLRAAGGCSRDDGLDVRGPRPDARLDVERDGLDDARAAVRTEPRAVGDTHAALVAFVGFAIGWRATFVRAAWTRIESDCCTAS